MLSLGCMMQLHSQDLIRIDLDQELKKNALYGSASSCDCEGNFDGDSDVDGSDAYVFKTDFGRSLLRDPCGSANPCNGDFDCDGDVDGSDAAVFKEDFGRGSLNNPCQPCTEACSY